MEAVAEVGRPPALTRVPGLPAWMAGVANWRGRVLAVLDLRSLLAAQSQPLDRRARLIVLNRGGVPVGLVSEGVEGTRMIADDQLEVALAHLPGPAAALLAGHVPAPGGPPGLPARAPLCQAVLYGPMPIVRMTCRARTPFFAVSIM